MIKQTQEQWMNSNYVASSNSGGISFPSYKKLSSTYNLDYFFIKDLNNEKEILNSFLQNENASLLEVLISENARVVPQVKYGRPNEDMEPLLPRDIFNEYMIIKPIDY